MTDEPSIGRPQDHPDDAPPIDSESTDELPDTTDDDGIPLDNPSG